MRVSRLILALTLLALLGSCSRAQTAVLVLTPSSTTTIAAGNGHPGFAGDSGVATAAQLAAPSAMARDAQGNLFLADTRNHRIRRIAADGTISTVAGTGAQGFSGDGGRAILAMLDSPAGVAVLSDSSLMVADSHNHRIRRVDPSGIIHTVAGTGVRGYTGDGSAAASAQLNNPTGVAVGLTGDLYIADTGNRCIRHLSADGVISTVAGDGTQGTSPDGTAATTAHLDTPVAVAVRADGSVLIADRGSNRILVLLTDGTLHLFSTAGLTLRRPGSVATNSFGETLIADAGNYRVAQIGSTGAGYALGAGEQGPANTVVAPVQSPLGAAVAVLDTSPTGKSGAGQISVLDRDNSQLLQVNVPVLSFADTVVATSSPARSVLLRNGGTSPLSVVSLVLPPAFTAAGASSCGSVPFQLAANASCQLDLVFTPSTVGPLTGLLEVSVAGGLPQRLTLTGNGLRTGTQLASTVSLQTSGTLNYAGMPIALTATVLGNSTAAATGTVTFLDGSTELGSSALNASAQASLSVSVLTTGSHSLSARYNGDAHYLGSASTLMPITVAQPPDFTLAASSPSSLVLHSGNPGTLAVTLQPMSGVLNRNISVTVQGLPAGTTINVTPDPVTLASDSVNVSIAFKLPVSLSQSQRPWTWQLALVLPGLLCLHSRRRRSHTLLIGSLLVLPLVVQGCGGGYLGGKSVTAQPASVTYPVTVTASCTGVTGATLIHTAAFTVEVQP